VVKRFWMGHEDEETGDIYSMLKQQIAYRKMAAERLGFGFEIPSKTVSTRRNLNLFGTGRNCVNVLVLIECARSSVG
jgi:hypothetical protein